MFFSVKRDNPVRKVVGYVSPDGTNAVRLTRGGRYLSLLTGLMTPVGDWTPVYEGDSIVITF